MLSMIQLLAVPSPSVDPAAVRAALGGRLAPPAIGAPLAEGVAAAREGGDERTAGQVGERLSADAAAAPAHVQRKLCLATDEKWRGPNAIFMVRQAHGLTRDTCHVALTKVI